MSAPDSNERMEDIIEVAIARVARGDAMFLPVTPTTTIEGIAAAVRRCAARRMLQVVIEDRADGVFVARQAGSV